MTDVARLGLVVDASGAKREIRLTREELIQLANTGKLAQKEVAGVAAPLTQTTVAARAATDGFTRLRGPLTQIAITASGIPGPFGRVASVLSQFAMGGGITVGVLAGVGAMSLAWKELTKDSELQRIENERVIESFKKMERELSASAKNIRIATLEAQEAALTERVGQGIRGFGTGDTFWEKWSGIGATRAYEAAKAQLQDVRNRLAELRKELNEFSREGGGIRTLPAVTVSAAAPDRRSLVPFGDDFVVEAKHAENAIEAYARQLAEAHDEAKLLRQEMAGLIGDTSKFGGGGFELDPNLFRKDGGFAKLLEELAAADKKKAATMSVMMGAGMGIAGGVVQQIGGPVGGAASGALSGLAAGAGPLGIAASAAAGLVSELFNMGQQAERAAEQMKAITFAFQSWVDAATFELGRITAGEKGARDASREAAVQRGNIFGKGPMSAAEAAEYIDRIEGLPGVTVSEETRRRIEEINRLEAELTEHRRKEADEIERINNAVRNAPSGFYVERYLRRLGTTGLPGTEGGGQWEGRGPTVQLWPGSSGGSNKPTPPSIVIGPGAIVVHGVSDPVQAAQLMVRGVRMIASGTVGNGGSLADALEYVQ